ncbi:hypothetical protein P7K49_012771 [Saguinus oedipus]|uniref:Uncharacterized protein n=1 Tax=Saguinus oedipus TaxID=9490 RepID=A0ABQ9VE07_SAGOE|nr:hypothetical protein P7K49_012771 [Saguinus oedipus]
MLQCFRQSVLLLPSIFYVENPHFTGNPPFHGKPKFELTSMSPYKFVNIQEFDVLQFSQKCTRFYEVSCQSSGLECGPCDRWDRWWLSRAYLLRNLVCRQSRRRNRNLASSSKGSG